ncbi:MAG: hypothetical protein GX590_08415 [Lentisphaerae bacterium]|nr:hypothetical protein [Lentisphaerota bacterium]
MKRNRKRRVQSRMMPVGGFALLVVLSLFSIGYVLLDSLCGSLSDRIRRLETEQEDLDFKVRREQNRWAAMTTADQIELALNRHGLNMTLPSGEQVVRLRVDPAGGVYRARDQFARRQ